MKTISLVIQKGGTGKTSTALAIAYGLADKGAKVLFVDMDAQGDSSASLGVKGGSPDISDVLKGDADIAGAALAAGAIHAIPSGDGLSLMDGAQVLALRDALESVSRFYDYAVIDTPPALGYHMAAALAASDYAVIPCECDSYSLAALERLSDTVQAVRETYNDGLKVAGVLFTKYNRRTVMAREFEDAFIEAAALLDSSLFDARIRASQAIKDANALQTSIYAYAPKAGVTADFRALVEELEGRI